MNRESTRANRGRTRRPASRLLGPAAPPRSRARTRRLSPVAPPAPPALAPAPFPADVLHPVEEHVSRYLRRRWSVRDGDRVVLGWSGSPGSTALLCALAACATGVGPRVRTTAVFVRSPRADAASRRLEEQGRALAGRLGVEFRVVEIADAPADGSVNGRVRGTAAIAVLRAVADELSAPVSLLGRTREDRVLEILHRVLAEGVLEELGDPPSRNGADADGTRPLASPFVEIDAAPVLRYATERAPEVPEFRSPKAAALRRSGTGLPDRILPAILEEYPYADTCILRLEQIAQQASRLLARRRSG